MILGIDTNSFGFAWVATEKLRGAWYGVIAQDGDALDRRMRTFPVARALFESLPRGTLVFIEEPVIMAKNPETTRKLTMMAGVIEAAFYASNVDAVLHWVGLSSWRKLVLGKGAGRKVEMKALAFQVVSGRLSPETLEVFEKDDNLCDAFCIADYGRAVSHLAERKPA